MIVAAAVLGTMIIWMAKNKNIAAELEEQAELAISSEKMAYGIFGLAFISVFREMLAALSPSQPFAISIEFCRPEPTA